MKIIFLIFGFLLIPFLCSGCLVAAAVGAGTGYIASKKEIKNQQTIQQAQLNGYREGQADAKNKDYK